MRAPGSLGPQPGPQEMFLQSKADIAIYGGAAGSGKSYALLLEPLRHYQNPKFGGIIFRRKSGEIVGSNSLWEEAQTIYSQVGANFVANPNHVVSFPGGGKLIFSHLQYEHTVLDHHGKAYAFIGFDEITTFEESQFWYLMSRLRSTSGIKPYIRCTTNPNPESFVRDLIDWWIGPDGFPIKERSGVLRWFTRMGGKLHWADTKKECEALIRAMGLEPGVDAGAMSFTFISAKLSDNPALTKVNPEYRINLMNQPEVDRERLLNGNWDIRPESGTFIRPLYFEKRWKQPLPPLNIYSASDFAVTPKRSGNKPDFTEHGIFGVDPEDNLYVLDWWYGRTASDVWIETLIDLWVKWKPITAFSETGVISQAIKPALTQRMRERDVYTDIHWMNMPRVEDSATHQGYRNRSKRAKAIKGRSFQALAARGKIIFPEQEVIPLGGQEWVDRVIEQLVQFPVGHDDAFDVMATMCAAIDQTIKAKPKKVVRKEKPDRWASAFKKAGRSERSSRWKVV